MTELEITLEESPSHAILDLKATISGQDVINLRSYNVGQREVANRVLVAFQNAAKNMVLESVEGGITIGSASNDDITQPLSGRALRQAIREKLTGMIIVPA